MIHQYHPLPKTIPQSGHKHLLLQPLHPHRRPPTLQQSHLPRHPRLPPRRIRQQSRAQLPSRPPPRLRSPRTCRSLPLHPRRRPKCQPDDNLHRLPYQPRRPVALAARCPQPFDGNRLGSAESRRASRHGRPVSFGSGVQFRFRRCQYQSSLGRLAQERPRDFLGL